jgi:hypothetical protein
MSDSEDDDLFADFEEDDESLANASISANLLEDVGRSADEYIVHRGEVRGSPANACARLRDRALCRSRSYTLASCPPAHFQVDEGRVTWVAPKLCDIRRTNEPLRPRSRP